MIIDTGNKYICFVWVEDKTKTQVWVVSNKSSGLPIARIEWYPPWRQYVIETHYTASIYNYGCLKTILAFIERLNKEKMIYA